MTHWPIVDSWIRNKEEPIPRSQAWSINATNNESQGTWYVEKSHTSKLWFVPHYSGTMAQRQQVPQVVVWRRLDRRANQTIRRTCLGRPFQWSYTWRKGTMAKELAYYFLNKEEAQGPIRQRPDFREAKHAYRQLYRENVESTGEGNKSIHPAQQIRQNYWQQCEGFRGVHQHGSPRTGWKYYPSTSSSSSSQWQQNDDWKSNQGRDYWRSSTWTEQ